MKNRFSPKSISKKLLSEKRYVYATDFKFDSFLKFYEVINFDCPNSVTDYVHRVGRCGRMGRKGHALTFITSKVTGFEKEKQI